jgi:toxin ParE1/3/4
VTADQGPKPAIPRVAAERDVEAIVDRLVREAGLETALRFIEAYGAACDHLGRHPGSGSPRLGHELDLPSLRSWPIRGFGHLVFYSEEPACLDIWRVLHGAQDLPRWLTDEAPD